MPGRNKIKMNDEKIGINHEWRKDAGKDFTPTFNPPPSRGRRKKGFLPPGVAEGKDGGDMIRSRARALRKNPTDAENKLWLHLRLRQIEGYKFRRQQPIGIYIVDFACMEEKLIVELDGGQHSERINCDSRLTAWLRSQGYRVLRFWNNEVLENIEVVLDVIFRALRK